jgi:hypothetical protein
VTAEKKEAGHSDSQLPSFGSLLGDRRSTFDVRRSTSTLNAGRWQSTLEEEPIIDGRLSKLLHNAEPPKADRR